MGRKDKVTFKFAKEHCISAKELRMSAKETN